MKNKKTNPQEQIELETSSLEGLELAETENGFIPVLDETYKPPGLLDIPEAVVRRFKRKGFNLQWIRIYIDNGELDVKNIRVKEADRFSFVTKEEVPEMVLEQTSFFGAEVQKHKDLITVGDLALAKVPIQHVMMKRKRLEEMNKEKTRAVINDLKQNDLRGEYKFTRDVPKTREVDFGE